MNEIMLKFYTYLIEENNPSSKEFYELKELAKSNNLDFLETYTLAIKKIEEIKQQAEILGFGLDFDSFCNILEKYLIEKKELSDSDKKNYLNILAFLSEIYDIDIREELENYRNKKAQEQHQKITNLIKKYLNPNYSFNELEEIKTNAKQKSHYEAITYVIDLKKKASKLHTDIDEISFAETMQEYKEIKKNLSDEEKREYLNFLVHLSRIYDVNLKDKIIETKEEKNFYFKNKKYSEIEKLFLERYETATWINLDEEPSKRAEVAYYRTLAKLVISKVISKEDKNNLNSFIALDDITWKSSKKNPDEALYHNLDFSKIKDLVNKYIPEIKNLLQDTLANEKKKKIIISEFQKSLNYIENRVNGLNKKSKIS